MDAIGMAHAYCGDGKGKSTAAFGLVLRAVSHGRRVVVLQFLKGTDRYGEVRLVRRAPFRDLVTLEQFGRACARPERPDCRGCTACHVDPSAPAEEDRAGARKGLARARRAAARRDLHLLVLDEILYAVAFGLLSSEEVCDLLDSRVESLEVVLTGNPLPDSIERRCDYVCVFHNRKHHISGGAVSVRGVDQ